MSNGVSFDSDVRKALITLAIEDALIEISQKVFEKVANQLKKDYNCYIPDCYSHPEYLQDVLKKLYNEYYDQKRHWVSQDPNHCVINYPYKQFSLLQ